MNKILGVFTVGIVLIAASMALVFEDCVETYYHERTASLDVSKDYVLDETGSFNKTATINRSDVLNAFSAPAGAKYPKIEIEELNIHVTIQSGNTAAGLILTGLVNEGFYSATPDTLFKNFPVALINIEIPGTEVTTNINTLLERGIGRLKKNLTDFVNKGIGPFYQTTSIFLSGHPTNGRAVLTVSIKVKATLTYGVCEDGLRALGGDPCPPDY
jgi:hypothetical protein